MQYCRCGSTSELYSVMNIFLFFYRKLFFVYPRRRLQFFSTFIHCFVVLRLLLINTPKSLSVSVISIWSHLRLLLEFVFDVPTCITLHLATLNFICHLSICPLYHFIQIILYINYMFLWINPASHLSIISKLAKFADETTV